MNHNLIKAGALAAAMTASVSSQAGLIVDTVVPASGPVYLIASDPNQRQFDYRHDLRDDGFVRGSALSAILDIYLSDDSYDQNTSSQRERVRFTVDGSSISTAANTSFNFVADFSADLASTFGVSVMATLNQYGKLDLSVKSLRGDFFFDYSRLTVTTDDAYQASEPGTLALLGLGLAGLGFSRRWIKKA